MKQKMIEVAFILVFFAIIMSVYAFGRWSASIDRQNLYQEAGCTIEDGALVCPIGLEEISTERLNVCINNDCMEITESTLISKEIYCQKYEYDGKEYASCSLVDVPFEMLDKFDKINLTPQEVFGDLVDCGKTTIIKSSGGAKSTVTGVFNNDSDVDFGQ
jgi:hypothetical protein